MCLPEVLGPPTIECPDPKRLLPVDLSVVVADFVRSAVGLMKGDRQLRQVPFALFSHGSVDSWVGRQPPAASGGQTPLL